MMQPGQNRRSDNGSASLDRSSLAQSVINALLSCSNST